MTTKSNGFDCLVSPISIAPDSSDMPIVLCDSNYKIIYKNAGAYHLGLNRVGSFITNHLSKKDKEELKRTRFSRETCVFVHVSTDGTNQLNAFVCQYKHARDHTTWIFPSTPNLLISKLKSKLLEFMPVFAQRICAPESSHSPLSMEAFKSHLTTKSLFSSFNYLMSNAPNNAMTYTSLCMIISRFANNELSSAGYNININFQLSNSVLLIQESYSFVCAYMAMLITILNNTSDKACEISIKIQNNYAVIETLSSQLPSDSSAEFYICRHLCRLFDFDLEIKEKTSTPFSVSTVLRVPLVLPGYLCSYNESDDFDVIYNKFMYFFKDI